MPGAMGAIGLLSCLKGARGPRGGRSGELWPMPGVLDMLDHCTVLDW